MTAAGFFMNNNASLAFGRTSAGIVLCFWGIFDTIGAISCVYSLIMSFVTDGWAYLTSEGHFWMFHFFGFFEQKLRF